MATLAKLTAMHEAGEISQQQLLCLSALLDQDLKAAQKAAGSLTIAVPGVISLSRTTNRSELVVMSRVLNISELRAEIFGYLSAEHLLLNVQPVCRGFRDTVQSATLQRQMYRAPAPENARQPPARLPFELHGLRNARVSKNAIVIVPSKLTDTAKQASLLRNTFICQPPQRLLKLESNFNPRATPSADLRDYTIYNPKGLRYGDVFDEIDKMDEMGLIEEFKNVAILRGSEKLVWQIVGYPEEKASWKESVYQGAPQGDFGS